jgi:hypothetical protein
MRVRFFYARKVLTFRRQCYEVQAHLGLGPECVELSIQGVLCDTEGVGGMGDGKL